MRIETVNVDVDRDDIVSVENHPIGGLQLEVASARHGRLTLYFPDEQADELREKIAALPVRDRSEVPA